MILGPLAAPDPAPLTLPELHGLGDGDVVVRDGVLGPALTRACAASMATLYEADRLTPAGIGLKGEVRPELRNDLTTWLGEVRDDPPLAALSAWFERLRLRLNEDAWLGLRRYAVQLAVYPPGSQGYVRHLDALRGDPNRVITAIVYLGEPWSPGDGGELDVWLPDGQRALVPEPGRLVLFRADRVPHAVRPSAALRRAATAWYRSSEVIPTLSDPTPWHGEG